VSNTFESFPQSDEQLDDMRELKNAAYALERIILRTAGYSTGTRYSALAMTHLETAVLFANKGISRRELP